MLIRGVRTESLKRLVQEVQYNGTSDVQLSPWNGLMVCVIVLDRIVAGFNVLLSMDAVNQLVRTL